MANELQGKRVAFITANEGVERAELKQPWDAVKAAGGTPQLIAPESGEVQTFDHLDKADTFGVDRTTADARAEDFDGIVLPGGVANPDQLRLDEPAVQLIKAFVDAGKPVAVICHGPWTLVEADVVRGRTLTSWPSVRTDLRNAGANWVDEQVQICEAGPNVIVSSRNPGDLPAFCAALIDVFSRGRKQQAA